jgi:hypothetical protein
MVLLDIKSARESGFRPKGEIRDNMEIPTANGMLMVVAHNNYPLQFFKVLR